MALTGYVSGLIVQSVPTRGVMKVDRFTADGTFTPPAGVTYAVAYIRGGGGGTGAGSLGGTGGTSSVAFASGTISATGGAGIRGPNPPTNTQAGNANSGFGSSYSSTSSGFFTKAQDGTYIVHGAAVTAGVGITVTVGAGGTAGTDGAAGGSGYVWIEYLA